MDLLQHFPNLGEYMQLVPVCLVGLLAGFVNYFSLDSSENKGTWKTALKTIATSSFLTLISYSILMATDLPYLAKVGISAAIGYFGIERAIELVQKMIALKSNNPNANKGSETKQ